MDLAHTHVPYIGGAYRWCDRLEHVLDWRVPDRS
jgi:hypothetical protein